MTPLMCIRICCGSHYMAISDFVGVTPYFHMAFWQKLSAPAWTLSLLGQGCRIPKPLTAASAFSAIVCLLNTHAFNTQSCTHRNTYLHTCAYIHSQTTTHTHTHLLKWSVTHFSSRNLNKPLSCTYSQTQSYALVLPCNKRLGYNAIVFRPEECEQSVPSGMWMNSAL